MKKTPIITSPQLICILVGCQVIFPVIYKDSNQDLWIQLILSYLYILLFSLPILFIINKFRGLDIEKILDILMGKFFSKILRIIFVLLFSYYLVIIISNLSLSFRLFLLQDTPSWAILFCGCVPICYASYKGAGIIGRLAICIIPLILLDYIFHLFFGIGKIQLSNLQPILADSTFMQLNLGALLKGASYIDILILLIFSFYLNRNSSINKTFSTSLLINITTLTFIIISSLTVLGSELSKHVFEPYYLFLRQLSAYDFIERIESINILLYLPTILLTCTTYNYAACYTLSGLFKKYSHKIFVVPLSIAVIIICLLPIMQKSSTILIIGSSIAFIIFPVIFVIPLIMLIIYFFRRKKINIKLKELLSANDPSC